MLSVLSYLCYFLLFVSSTDNLQKIAKKYLSIPGTSVLAERLFSTAREVVSAKRNRLTPEHVNVSFSEQVHYYIYSGMIINISSYLCLVNY